MDVRVLRAGIRGIEALCRDTQRSLRSRRLLVPSSLNIRRFNIGARQHATTHEISKSFTPFHHSRPVRHASVDHQQSSLIFESQHGERTGLPLLYLRDSCPCPACRHEVTHQRLVDTFKLPVRPAVEDMELSQNGLAVTWESDGHRSLYSWTQLADLLTTATGPEPNKKDVNGELATYTLWDASIATDPPTVSYEEVMESDEGVRRWTKLIRTHGFSTIEDCPATPEATEKLLERLSFIRSTHYGGFWDFTSDLRSKDTAYTSLALEAHTDTNYFKDPAGLQMFHMLSHTDGSGGESLFVDGYKAAAVLRARSPALAEVLRRHKVLYECKGNDDVMLHAIWPVLPSASTPSDGDLIAPHDPLMPIRWNNSDRAAQMPSAAAAEEWYEAARAFDGILKDPAYEYWVKLKPGTPISRS